MVGKSIGNRLDALERKSGARDTFTEILYAKHGTRDEVKAEIAKAEAEVAAKGGQLIALIPVPYVGESMNECRAAIGKDPFDDPRCDTPTQRDTGQ